MARVERMSNVAMPALMLLATAFLPGCPPAADAPERADGPPSPAPAPAPSPPAAAPAAVPPADAPAPGAAATPAAATPAVVIPAGVAHVAHARWVDREWPNDLPSPPVDTTAAAQANAAAFAAADAALAAACKADAARVVRLDAASRVGYEAYKNGNLPVKGKFDRVAGFAVLGATPRLRVWVDVLSINSGDPVRDARLLKYFFEADKPGGALLTFESDAVAGLGPDGALSPTGGPMTWDGRVALHGADAPLTLKLTLGVGAAPGRWTATLAEETLLPFDPFGLTDPLRALMEACNHKSMGAAVKLEFDLHLTAGCAG